MGLAVFSMNATKDDLSDDNPVATMNDRTAGYNWEMQRLSVKEPNIDPSFFPTRALCPTTTLSSMILFLCYHPKFLKIFFLSFNTALLFMQALWQVLNVTT